MSTCASIERITEEKKTITPEKKEELVQAIRNGNTSRITSIEKEYPGSVNEKDKNGRPLTFEAIDRGQLGSFTCMIELGADKEATDKFQRKALHIAGMQRRREIAQYLVGKRAIPSKDAVVDEKGKPKHRKRPSYWAAKAGDTYLATLLRKHETDMSREKSHQRAISRATVNNAVNKQKA
jgi:ankyrin repeat protein